MLAIRIGFPRRQTGQGFESLYLHLQRSTYKASNNGPFSLSVASNADRASGPHAYFSSAQAGDILEDEQILQLVKSLFRDRRMGRYHRVDLHIHSPVSTDYSGDKNVSEHDFVSAFADRGFDLIAITDHNSGAYVDRAIEARNQLSETLGKNITVLPGVEMHVSPGIHLLAILPTGGSAGIADLLSHLGLHVENHGDSDALIAKPIAEIARVVHDRGGILIGAHCNSNKGIVSTLQGQSRLEWLESLDALEINAGTADDKVGKDMNYVINDLGVQIPFTFGSDSHDCSSDTTGMWVKMAEPSFGSLRQLIFEPELRVSRVEPALPAHGRVVGFTTTHGIYADERFRFSPNLNVLVGGRGAGKSAVIDLLRFAFEAEPRTGDDNSVVFANRIMGFLQSVGEVLLVVVGADKETYAITRSGAYEKSSSRSTPTFTDSARVYQVADDKLIPRDIRPLDVLGIEFYGQGEAARLANRVGEQLRLIDENLDHSVSTDIIAAAERDLTTDEDLLTGHKQSVEKLRVKAAARPQLEARRDRLAESLADPIFAERTRWDRERVWVQGRQDWVQAVIDILPESMPSRADVPINIEESSAKHVLQKIRDASDQVLENGRIELKRFRETIAQVVSELEGYRTEWNNAFEIADNQYRARLAELGAANLDQAAAEQRSVEKELTHIETAIEPEIERIQKEIADLELRRVKLLESLREGRSAIDSSRADFVEELNSRLGGSVMVSLCGSDTSLYFDAVDSPLQGSGMQHREEQISLACDSFAPERFVEIVRAASIDQLMAVGITENNGMRMIKSLTDDALNKIERVEVPTLPSIRIKREGETSYTDLSALSVGEKCSAILSIALLSKGKPLVIDQPEDDLDHAFIINSIVQGIRTAKSGRQIIAATHNPNIPVLGDAEMVFRVARQAGDDICRIATSGGLELRRVTEEVQNLEGGAEAFERRRQKYSSTL